MNDWLPTTLDVITPERLFEFVRAAILVLSGFLFARLISRALVRAARNSLDTHRSMLLKRGSYYLVLLLFLVSALYELGFNLNVLMGTAGLVTVAVGFASQTSMSNLISGLFLVSERPFMAGDVIQVGSTLGEVLSIDLLSVKLRKFDNTFVRIPNEMLVKVEVSTLTKFSIRRVDIPLTIAYHCDLAQVHGLLMGVAEKNPLALQEPRPLYIFRGFGASGQEIQFSVWATKENFLAVKNSIQQEIKRAFDAAGIEIPFPHLSLYTGAVTEPLPIRLEGPLPTPSAGEDA